MSTADDIKDGLSIAGGSLPIITALALAIAKVVNAKDDPIAQLDALQDAAEAVKLRMDQLKFPEESEKAEHESRLR